MPDYIAEFYAHTPHPAYETHFYYGCTLDSAIRRAKRLADKEGYRGFEIRYIGSARHIGRWAKKSTRWYKTSWYKE